MSEERRITMPMREGTVIFSLDTSVKGSTILSSCWKSCTDNFVFPSSLALLEDLLWSSSFLFRTSSSPQYTIFPFAKGK